MNEELKIFLKWFFISLGVLFFVIILSFIVLIFSAYFSVHRMFKYSNNMHIKPKEMQTAVEYIEKYRNENNKYPNKLDGIKLNNKINYKYEVSKDGNCYNLILLHKKNSLKQQYHTCRIESDTTNSFTQDYSEIK